MENFFLFWCFCHSHSSIFSKSHFTLSLFSLLSLSILCLDCLSHYPCSSYEHCLSQFPCSSYEHCSYLYTKLSLCDFSLLPSLLTNYFCLPQTLFRSAHCPSSLMSSTFTTSEHVQHFLSLPLPIPWQTLTYLILLCTSLSPLNGKTLGLFLPIPLAWIKWSQPVYYLFWVEMLSQWSISQKRS